MANADSLETNDFVISVGRTQEQGAFAKSELPRNLQELGHPRRELTPTLMRGEVLSNVVEHLQAENNRERGGFFVGRFIKTKQGRLADVTHFLPAEFGQRTAGSITLMPDDFSNANRWVEENRPGSQIVGWVHSHPFWTPAPSSDDVFIMEHFFNLPRHVTMIINPNTRELGDFRWVNGQVKNTGGIYLDRDREGVRGDTIIDGVTNDVRLDQKSGTQKVTLNTLPDNQGKVFKVQVDYSFFEKFQDKIRSFGGKFVELIKKFGDKIFGMSDERVRELITVHPSQTSGDGLQRITKEEVGDSSDTLRITKEDIK